ncbi:MAG: YhbY family RNA-binding protein [Candidatus Bathyarchaeota archaeon]|nr:YhbY family RNA-binding protein [Candidatus Bathyarchaeota archaeon]
MLIKAKHRMRGRSNSMKPLVRIGKQGVSRRIIEAIDSHLERKETVKVRVLKTGLEERDVKDISSEIIKKTRSHLVEIRGHTFVLFRKKRET